MTLCNSEPDNVFVVFFTMFVIINDEGRGAMGQLWNFRPSQWSSNSFEEKNKRKTTVSTTTYHLQDQHLCSWQRRHRNSRSSQGFVKVFRWTSSRKYCLLVLAHFSLCFKLTCGSSLISSNTSSSSSSSRTFRHISVRWIFPFYALLAFPVIL